MSRRISFEQEQFLKEEHAYLSAKERLVAWQEVKDAEERRAVAALRRNNLYNWLRDESVDHPVDIVEERYGIRDEC